MFRKTYAEINLDHLQHNLSLLQENISSETFFCPMVKANAYGHGDVTMARALETMGIKAMGVCLIEEGLLLRQFGVKTEILVFRGFDLEGARTMLQYQLTPVVSDWHQLEHLDHLVANSDSGICRLHLKFDTGMNRLGFSAQEAQRVFAFIEGRKKFQVAGVLTHLFQGEDGLQLEGQTALQLQRFDQVRSVFQSSNPQFHALKFHVLNSGGLLSQKLLQKRKISGSPLTEHPWGARPGLALYGYNPLDHSGSEMLQDLPQDFPQLRPVMTLKSTANVYRKIPSGEGVSYNHTWKASRDSLIAVVPMGYADGFHRILSNRTSVLFCGQRVPIVGNICMDYLMLDVTSVEQAKPEINLQDAEVVFFGQGMDGKLLSAAEQALAAGTITWEVLTSVGERVPRVFVTKSPKIRELL